eukprot:Opistho-2@81185
MRSTHGPMDAELTSATQSANEFLAQLGALWKKHPTAAHRLSADVVDKMTRGPQQIPLSPVSSVTIASSSNHDCVIGGTDESLLSCTQQDFFETADTVLGGGVGVLDGQCDMPGEPVPIAVGVELNTDVLAPIAQMTGVAFWSSYTQANAFFPPLEGTHIPTPDAVGLIVQALENEAVIEESFLALDHNQHHNTDNLAKCGDATTGMCEDTTPTHGGIASDDGPTHVFYPSDLFTAPQDVAENAHSRSTKCDDGMLSDSGAPLTGEQCVFGRTTMGYHAFVPYASVLQHQQQQQELQCRQSVAKTGKQLPMHSRKFSGRTLLGAGTPSSSHTLKRLTTPGGRASALQGPNWTVLTPFQDAAHNIPLDYEDLDNGAMLIEFVLGLMVNCKSSPIGIRLKEGLQIGVALQKAKTACDAAMIALNKMWAAHKEWRKNTKTAANDNNSRKGSVRNVSKSRRCIHHANDGSTINAVSVCLTAQVGKQGELKWSTLAWFTFQVPRNDGPVTCIRIDFDNVPKSNKKSVAN